MHILNNISGMVFLFVSKFLCFTETHLDNRPLKTVMELNQELSDIYKHTPHGLAVCYDTNKAKII